MQARSPLRCISFGCKEPARFSPYLPPPPLVNERHWHLFYNLLFQEGSRVIMNDLWVHRYKSSTSLVTRAHCSSRSQWASSSFHFSNPCPGTGNSARIAGSVTITLIPFTFSLFNSQYRNIHKTYNKGFIPLNSIRKDQTTRRKQANYKSRQFRKEDLKRPPVIWFFSFQSIILIL